MKRFYLRFVLLLPLICAWGAAPAEPARQTPQQRQTEVEAAFKDAVAAGTHGPAAITLNDQGNLQLGGHMAWVPRAQANRLIMAWGNTGNPETLGMVLAANGKHLLPLIVSYAASGYIKDADAADLNPGTILDKIRSGTDHDNEGRIARGFPPLDVGAWLQPPSYDTINKRLIWAFPLSARDQAGELPTVNYNTRTLGRYGYFSLNLLTDPVHFATDKPVADRILTGLSFQPGKRYADFVAGTDHVAEYGLAALIGVVALKKLGLIALAGVFVLKFAKIGALMVFGAAAAARRFLTRRKNPATPAAGPPES